MKLPTHWTTKDKRSIPIAGMSDGHLLNSIAMVKRQAGNAQEHDSFSCMAAAASFDSDSMASYYAAGMADDMMRESTKDWLERQPLWRALTREAKRRNLTLP